MMQWDREALSMRGQVLTLDCINHVFFRDPLKFFKTPVSLQLYSLQHTAWFKLKDFA